jgi:hypothetical protein
MLEYNPAMRGAALALLLLALAGNARADEVTDQLDEAKKAYQANDLATARTALEAATTLLRQKQADLWAALLPAPLSGWTSEEPKTAAYGAALLGGGTTVERSYRRDRMKVTISLIADSPLLATILPLFTSGLMTGEDHRMLVIDGRRAIFDKHENSYQLVVANKILVKIEGSHDTDDAALRAYLAAIKFADLEKMR